MLIVRHLGTPNSDFNGCHCVRDPVLYRSMLSSLRQTETLMWGTLVISDLVVVVTPSGGVNMNPDQTHFISVEN